jgi:diacylglycerol kinase family enzyme
LVSDSQREFAGDEALREGVSRKRAQGITLDVRVTWEAGDCERHVGEAIAQGIDVIIAGGGDGTLSEVATSLRGARKRPPTCRRWACSAGDGQ